MSQRRKREVADEVVEKSQLSCLILPINTGSELFSRVGCWDAGARRFAVSGEPTSKERAVADEVVERINFRA